MDTIALLRDDKYTKGSKPKITENATMKQLSSNRVNAFVSCSSTNKSYGRKCLYKINDLNTFEQIDELIAMYSKYSSKAQNLKTISTIAERICSSAVHSDTCPGVQQFGKPHAHSTVCQVRRIDPDFNNKCQSLFKTLFENASDRRKAEKASRETFCRNYDKSADCLCLNRDNDADYKKLISIDSSLQNYVSAWYVPCMQKSKLLFNEDEGVLAPIEANTQQFCKVISEMKLNRRSEFDALHKERLNIEACKSVLKSPPKPKPVDPVVIPKPHKNFVGGSSNFLNNPQVSVHPSREHQNTNQHTVSTHSSPIKDHQHHSNNDYSENDNQNLQSQHHPLHPIDRPFRNQIRHDDDHPVVAPQNTPNQADHTIPEQKTVPQRSPEESTPTKPTVANSNESLQIVDKVKHYFQKIKVFLEKTPYGYPVAVFVAIFVVKLLTKSSRRKSVRRHLKRRRSVSSRQTRRNRSLNHDLRSLSHSSNQDQIIIL